MSRRYGRVLIAEHSAKLYAYDALCRGSDHADMAGNCQSPVMVAMTGEQSKLLIRERDWKHRKVDYAEGYGIVGPWSEPRFRHVDVAVRCRKCPACLAARAAHWRMRAQSEIAAASRTWFGTLTLRPEMHFRCVAIAAKRLSDQAVALSSLTPAEQFTEICKPLTHECQLWVKRLRKQAEGLRYCLVVERHKSGLPHCHVLVHESGQPIRHRALADAWRWGFVKFNLVAEGDGPHAARYVAKYLSKEALTRVKASCRYGEDREPMVDPRSAV